jgi:glycosyltransferase involved in cell wall biosynthesis
VLVYTVLCIRAAGTDTIAGYTVGTPLIVTVGCGEVIEEADCGYIVEYGDIEDLANKVTCGFKIHVFVN